MPLDPVAVAKKWATNLSGASAQIQAGVQAVTTNPAQLAAAQQNAYLAGVQRAVASGAYTKGLSRVTLQSWQQAMINKGIPRIALGAQQGQTKMQQFMTAWLPYMAAGQQLLSNTPRGDLQTNIQRMVQLVNYAAAFPGVP